MGLLDQYDKAKKYAAGLLAQVPQNAQDMYQGFLSAPSQVSDLFSQQKAQQLAKALKNPQQANPKQWMDAGMNLAGMAPVGGLIGMTKGADGLLGMADNVGMSKPALHYQIDHKPMTVEGGAARLHDLAPSFGDDIYGKNALRYFGSGEPAERTTLKLMQSLRGNPDAMVSIYRGVPDGVNNINPGDWVTLDKNIAKMYADPKAYGEGAKGAGKVLEIKVPAKHVTSWPDSLVEFGYYPD